MSEAYTLAQLKQLVGQEIAVSEWVAIPQERIELFADATGDHQWIHVDEQRCRTESPFKTTVAHGFLTLSLLPMLMGSLCTPPTGGLTINYGLNKVRFPAPVPVGSKLRGRMKLLAMDELADCIQATWQVTVEREGGEKPACVAESIYRHYPPR